METFTQDRTTSTTTTQDPSSPWIVCQKRNPQARMRLFCFPYAGGGASIFNGWHEGLPEMEVCAVQPPGRERRLLEPAFSYLLPLVTTLTRVLHPYMDMPFAFFGHSMGSLVAFELARCLNAAGGPTPDHLFVSGHRAPHLEDAEPPIYRLPEATFIQELRRLNGTPEAVLANDELMQLLLPALRADFTLCGTYQYHAGDRLECPIHSFGGVDDPKAASEQLAPWAEHTTGAFSLCMLPGNHFFVHSARPLILRAISEELASPVSADNRVGRNL